MVTGCHIKTGREENEEVSCSVLRRNLNVWESAYGDCESPIEFLQVKIKMVVSKGDHRVGTCY